MSKQDLHFALIKADRVHNIIVADEEFIAELQTRRPSLWDSIEPGGRRLRDRLRQNRHRLADLHRRSTLRP